MKRYVNGIGYIEVVEVGQADLPRNTIFFDYDDDWFYYITGDNDTVYAVNQDKPKDAYQLRDF